ncbi:hypothetical protein K8I85_08210 [bacterium]|nr:hypothetical protein [bacterium]
MRPLTAAVLATPLLAALPGGAAAQVLRELEPIHLEYTLYWGEPLEPVGEATVSFVPTDTKRGRRVEVQSATHYVLEMAPKLDYSEECAMTCDETGVTRFQTVARALGQERTNIALRVGDHFQVTSTFGGKTTNRTITSGVRQSNFALFAGGFLPDHLDRDGMLIDYPLLYPVGGDHIPHQKYREAVLPFVLRDGSKVPAITTRLKHRNETSDYLWNVEKDHQILLKMDRRTPQGLIVYILTSVNGVAPEKSELIR